VSRKKDGSWRNWTDSQQTHQAQKETESSSVFPDKPKRKNHRRAVEKPGFSSYSGKAQTKALLRRSKDVEYQKQANGPESTNKINRTVH
jgi:hypothetical protein